MNQANKGRFGDSKLVHMRPDELQALGLLAQATGSQLTTNPQTGYPEAFSLPKWLLPAAAIAATVATGGAAAPAAAGALGAGAGTAAAGAGTAALAGGAAASGAAGGAGLLGATGAAGTAAGTAAGAGTGLLGAAAPAAAPTGLLGTVNAGLKTYSPMISAVGTGVNAVSGGQGDAPLQAPQLTPPTSGAQSIGDVASSRMQATQNTMAQADQERMRRRMQRRGY